MREGLRKYFCQSVVNKRTGALFGQDPALRRYFNVFFNDNQMLKPLEGFNFAGRRMSYNQLKS
jgi:hypothetical protein